MNVYKEWVLLNNELQRLLLEKCTTSKSASTIHHVNDEYIEKEKEYRTIFTALDKFIVTNFPEMHEEHFRTVYEAK
jgi:hypothetical protein